jgi:hypothetical protein
VWKIQLLAEVLVGGCRAKLKAGNNFYLYLAQMVPTYLKGESLCHDWSL